MQYKRALIELIGSILLMLIIWGLSKRTSQPKYVNEGQGGELFSMPGGYVALVGVCACFALLAAGLTIHGALTWNTGKEAALQVVSGVLACVLCSAGTVYLLRLAREKVVAGEKGISQTRGGGTVSMEWREVEKIETQRRLQRLLLTGSRGRVVKLEFQLVNFKRLFDIILKHWRPPSSALDQRQFGNPKFRLNYFLTASGVAAVFEIFLLLIPNTGVLVLLALPAIFSFALLLDWKLSRKNVGRVEIKDGVIILKSNFGEASYPLASIVSMDLEQVEAGHGSVGLRTDLKMVDGKIFGVPASTAEPLVLIPVLEKLVGFRRPA